MSNKKDVLQIWKERIKREARHGDKTKACRDAGTTLPVYQTAMRRASFDELTDGELLTMQKLIERLNARKANIQQIQMIYGK